MPRSEAQRILELLWFKCQSVFYIIANKEIIIGSHAVPLSGIIAVAFVVILLSRWKFSIRSLPWRVRVSRKWLKRFRASARHFNNMQRFAFIRKTDPFLWEEIILTCFKERGYAIQRTPYTRDGGKDGIVFIDGKRVIIQAKRYRGAIKKQHVSDFVGLVATDRTCDYGLFIHTGKTSEPIKAIFRQARNIEILSGIDRIVRFLDGESLVLFGVQISATSK